MDGDPNQPAGRPGAWRTVATYRGEDAARRLVRRLRRRGAEGRVMPVIGADYYGPGGSAYLGRLWEVQVPEGSQDAAYRILDEGW